MYIIVCEYMQVRPENVRVIQQREIRNRAHGNESIEVLSFAARVPKGFAPVYSDVQQHERKRHSTESAKKRWQGFGKGFGLRSK
jgi:hypothetical protein